MVFKTFYSITLAVDVEVKLQTPVFLTTKTMTDSFSRLEAKISQCSPG